jgi:hypothetical protein
MGSGIAGRSPVGSGEGTWRTPFPRALHVRYRRPMSKDRKRRSRRLAEGRRRSPMRHRSSRERVLLPSSVGRRGPLPHFRCFEMQRRGIAREKRRRVRFHGRALGGRWTLRIGIASRLAIQPAFRESLDADQRRRLRSRFLRGLALREQARPGSRSLRRWNLRGRGLWKSLDADQRRCLRCRFLWSRALREQARAGSWSLGSKGLRELDLWKSLDADQRRRVRSFPFRGGAFWSRAGRGQARARSWSLRRWNLRERGLWKSLDADQRRRLWSRFL